jgi:6-pyruvoyltetrahydropterin/6-carboxytetrahydropterin synthase
MYTLEKKFTFEASHVLPNHDGKCSRLHGHSWQGAIICEGKELQMLGSKAGMLIDYGDLSSAIKPFVEDYLDHWHLNDTTRLENPTSELLAKWVYDNLKKILPNLVAVRIEETCTSAATYREPND